MATPPSTELGFTHQFVTGEGAQASTTLLLLHGTGGDENDLLPLGRALMPGAALLSPRGQVLEHDMPRFFRRFAEGVFDEEDLVTRTGELVQFVERAAARYDRDPARIVAVGFSNGANIAASALLLYPNVFRAGVLLRPMVPFESRTAPRIPDTPVLIAAGRLDPIVPVANSERLAALLRDAGADVVLRYAIAGHELSASEVGMAKQWLADALHQPTRDEQ